MNTVKEMFEKFTYENDSRWDSSDGLGIEKNSIDGVDVYTLVDYNSTASERCFADEGNLEWETELFNWLKTQE